ncbi:unnamed protein product [Closterium sp. NIES-64]|nr:unnamed protein product [Closterium sp. NIES-64]
MYAVTYSDEGDCYRCFPPDPGIGTAALGAGEAAALGASAAVALGASASASSSTGESALSGTASASASLTFTLDSGASRSFFRDHTTLTPLGRPVAVSLADPSGSSVLSHFSTVLPCPAAPSGTLSGLYLPSFSTNLVSGADLQDAGVHQFTPASQRVTHCSDARTGRHLATFTRRPGSSLYTLTTESPPVPASGQVVASGQVFAAASRSGPESAPCSCRLLSHETLLWHHRLGHPSLPRLRGMASRVLVSGLPRSLPPLPSGPGPSCVPCVEGRLRAAPHSSTFPPKKAPLQTLHMNVWGPARVRGQGHERYFLLVVDDYSRYTTVFPLRRKGDVTEVLIDWIRAARLQLTRSFGSDFPVLRLHSNRGGEFSSGLLRAYCRARGIRKTFTLPDSPQQNGIAERRIGMVMDVARTSMMHTAAPHFLWPFAVRYAAHQINLHPRVSRPETSPALLWTGKTRSSRSRLLVTLGLLWVHSLGVLTPGVLRGWVLRLGVLGLRVVLMGVLSLGVLRLGVLSLGVLRLGVLSLEVLRLEVLSLGVPRLELLSLGVRSRRPMGLLVWRLAVLGLEVLQVLCLDGSHSLHRSCVSGLPGAGGVLLELLRLLRVLVPSFPEVLVPRVLKLLGLRVRLDLELLRVLALRLLLSVLETVLLGVLLVLLEVLQLAVVLALSQSQLPPASPLPAPSPYTGPTGGLAERREPASRPASPVRAARTSGRGSRQRPPPFPSTHRMSLHPSTAPLRAPLPSPPVSSLPALADPESDSLRAASPTMTRLLATVVTDPSFDSTAASALVAELVDFAARCRLDYAASLVAESASVCRPSVGGECALGTDVLEDRQEEFQCLAAASPHLVSVLLTPEGDPDALDISTPRSYAEAVEGPYSSQVKRPPGSPPVFKARYVARGFKQRQGVDYFQTFSPTPKMTTLRVLLHIAAQRDYELHSLDFSTAFLQVYGLRQAPREWHDTLRTTLAALGFAPSTADPSLFLRTDTSLAPFYILVYVDDLVFATADTAGLAHVKSELQKRHTCTDLGELRSYLGLQITRDRARRTIILTHSHMVQQVLQRFSFTYSSPQATPLPTRHSLSALPSDESVELSGPYPELVGCLMYLMTCTRPDLAYPLSILARYVAPGRHRPEHMAAAKRVLRYLCSTSGMGLVLGGRSPVVLTGHADASWADDQATQRSSQGYTFSLGSGSVSWRATRSSSVLGSSCEAEIYAGAMAAQELRWLTYLLTDLEEPPRSPPVLYVVNKAMLALCREQRLEHRTKHIALRYFLARELQQRGQLRLAYVASEANTADIFTKALPPCDHQRFCTQLGLVPVLPHLLTS